MSDLRLSVVLPAYNEEEFIEGALRSIDMAVKTANLKYEVLVVNDGSHDRTLDKVMKYAKSNKHVRIVSYQNNKGKGFAEKSGFQHACGDIVIFSDSDQDIDLKTVSFYLKALEQGDIVIASKFHPDSIVSTPPVRKLLSLGLNVIVRLLTGVPFRDTQTGLKAMNRESCMNIFSLLSVKRFAFDVELLAVANLYGLKVVELPVRINLKGAFGLKQIWLMFLDSLRIAYRLRITHWYQNPPLPEIVFKEISEF